MALDLQVSLGYPHDGCEGARPDRRCVLLFVNAENVFYALPQGYRALVYVLRLGDQTLVATVEAPPAAFDRFSSLAEQVLATLGPRR